MKSNRPQAQRNAERRADEKRRHAARLPGARLTEEEARAMEALYDKFDSKKDAVLTAVQFYLKHHEA